MCVHGCVVACVSVSVHVYMSECAGVSVWVVEILNV
jgi:hypothetical protein